MDLSKADKKYAIFFIYRPLKQNINFFLVRDNQKDFAFIWKIMKVCAYLLTLTQSLQIKIWHSFCNSKFKTFD